MREIKFRTYYETSRFFSKGLMHYFSDMEQFITFFSQDYEMLIKSTLMQYTGLKDKNGKEIYEGDILKTDFNDIAEVKYGLGCFHIESNQDYESITLFEWSDDMSEVIGNIYENPELIKDK